MKGLKINLHITETCNYSCKYCFAHFGKQQDISTDAWKKVIDNIKASGMVSDINFAGGEPVLHKGFCELVAYAKEKGFGVSLISNGSLLLNDRLTPAGLFKRLDTLGISVDSFSDDTLVALGCCDKSKKVLSYERLQALIRRAKAENPDIRIKLNTVVSRLNVHEKLTGIEEELPIDRWKFLKMKGFKNDSFSNMDLLVSDDEFAAFLANNQRTRGESVPEQSLTRSYIMVDNRGNLVDDEGDDYTIVGNLTTESFTDVFGRYAFDEDLYNSRYGNIAV